MKRKPPNMHEKLACALLQLGHIERERAKSMTAKQIISAYQFDHSPVPVALGGSNHPTNLVPLIKAEHRDKTNTFDVPSIARVARVSKEHEAFQRRILAKKTGQGEAPEEKPKRKHRWGSRKMRSRNNLRRNHA